VSVIQFARESPLARPIERALSICRASSMSSQSRPAGRRSIPNIDKLDCRCSIHCLSYADALLQVGWQRRSDLDVLRGQRLFGALGSFCRELPRHRGTSPVIGTGLQKKQKNSSSALSANRSPSPAELSSYGDRQRLSFAHSVDSLSWNFSENRGTSPGQTSRLQARSEDSSLPCAKGKDRCRRHRECRFRSDGIDPACIGFCSSPGLPE